MWTRQMKKTYWVRVDAAGDWIVEVSLCEKNYDLSMECPGLSSGGERQ